MKEEAIEMRIERGAEAYMQKYPEQMEALESASVIKAVRPITAFDIWALGEQLSQWENYMAWMQEAGTAADLGALPNIALDVITASYGASIIPFIASVQPIDEERGTIYFKQTKALTTRGNVTAAQILRNPLAVPAAYAVGYAGEKVTESLGNTAGGDQSYNGTLTGTPTVRPNSVKVTINTPTPLTATDDGNGYLQGAGVYGTITYAGGAWTIELTSNPGGTYAMSMDYGTDFESTGTIPEINTVTASTSIDAEIFALTQSVGLFKAFSMKKRFGVVAEDEMAQDLTNEITAEIGHTGINRLIAGATGNINWDRTPPSGVSWADHKLELLDIIAQSEANILAAAGRGVVNVLICGATAASIVSTLPGFVKQPITGTGPTVYGTLNGMTVIRDPRLTATKIYCVYRGTGSFDAPLVYSPYMPLMVQTQQDISNPLKRQGVVAVWAGLKQVVSGFVTVITITQS